MVALPVLPVVVHADMDPTAKHQEAASHFAGTTDYVTHEHKEGGGASKSWLAPRIAYPSVQPSGSRNVPRIALLAYG